MQNLIKPAVFVLLMLVLAIQSFSQNISNDTLHWNQDRPITWADFKGESMEFTGFNGENFCLLSANYNRSNSFAKTVYVIEAIFDRDKSWISETAKNPNNLMFFQASFDIYELNARKLRKKCSELPRDADPTVVLQPTYNQTMSELMAEYNMFRKETKMGLDEESVKAWADAISMRLSELNDFR